MKQANLTQLSASKWLEGCWLSAVRDRVDQTPGAGSRCAFTVVAVLAR